MRLAIGVLMPMECHIKTNPTNPTKWAKARLQ